MTPAEIEAAYNEQFRHRRFGYGLEFIENGQGTIEQRYTIRKSVQEQAAFGSPADRLLLNLARHVKYRKHFVAILFDDLVINGFAGAYSMVLNQARTGTSLLYTFWHELGHIVDHRMFEQKHKDHFQATAPNLAAGSWRQPDNYATTPNEQWARAFSRWVLDGSDPEVPATLALDGWTS